MSLSDEKIPALCPICAGKDKDCEKCGGTGKVNMTIAKGFMYARECSFCGAGNGMKVFKRKQPERKKVTDVGQRHCIVCKKQTMEWKFVLRTDED